MTDMEKVIKGLEHCRKTSCESCPYNATDKVCLINEMLSDALLLLKDQYKRYAMIVVDWLRDMAHNNYLDSSHMTFWDAILDIRERAQTGLENYFRDYDSDTKQQEGRQSKNER